ncbi:MAG: hypothetical protein MJA83_14075 [Gammaproteobacteria bacterium]|nr:hypothetical protein [Gammaproteobacteria bacterium]
MSVRKLFTQTLLLLFALSVTSCGDGVNNVGTGQTVTPGAGNNGGSGGNSDWDTLIWDQDDWQ